MKLSLFLLVVCILFPGCKESAIDHPEFERYFRQYNVEGSFLLYDLRNDSYTYYNLERCKKPFIPASTFKIFNSLVALETGVIKDETVVLPWNGVHRATAAWNQDQDMTAAIKNSTVWFYEELARRIGEKNMQRSISLVRYGNMNIAGGIDMFWLTGKLRISQMEQIQFLKRLYTEELPFSPRTMQIVKKILIQEETPLYTPSCSPQPVLALSVLFFATNIESENPDESLFPGARIAITRQILQDLQLL